MSEKPLSLFQQALLEIQLEKFKDIPAENEINLTPSEIFEKKSRALIRQESQMGIKKMRKSIQRVVLIAAILTLLTITTLALPTVQEELMRFFATNEGSYYAFTFDPELLASAPKKIEKVYKPTYIPEGFQEESVIGEEWAVYKWKSESGATITCGQYPLANESVRPQPNTEGTKVEQFQLNDYPILCIYSGDNRMYFWTDNVYFYRLVCSNTVSKEECDKLFCSIEENRNVILAP